MKTSVGQLSIVNQWTASTSKEKTQTFEQIALKERKNRTQFAFGGYHQYKEYQSTWLASSIHAGTFSRTIATSTESTKWKSNAHEKDIFLTWPCFGCLPHKKRCSRPILARVTRLDIGGSSRPCVLCHHPGKRCAHRCKYVSCEKNTDPLQTNDSGGFHALRRTFNDFVFYS